jgi:hypothetical protein
MAYELPLFQPAIWKANSDFTTKQYLAVNPVVGSDSLMAVDIVATAGIGILGINQDDCVAGGAPSLTTEGISKAKAGGTIAIGNLLMVNASGQLVLATTGNVAVAIAMEAAVSGDIFSAYLRNQGKQ